MAERDGLDQLQIQLQSAADGFGDFGYKLDMERTAAQIVIAVKRKDLSLIAVSVIERAVNDFIHIVRKGRADDGKIRDVLAGANGIIAPGCVRGEDSFLIAGDFIQI
jgi:hypothetical protein